MTLIDKIVHYIFLPLIWTVFKLVYLRSEVAKKSDTFLHNIHPGPFDPYVNSPLLKHVTPNILGTKVWREENELLQFKIAIKLRKTLIIPNCHLFLHFNMC